MKKVHVIYKAAFLLLAISLSSCEKEITLDLKSVEPNLVIEGLVPADSLAGVKLTRTKDFNTDNTYPPVESATVTITDSENNWEVLVFSPASGWYEAKRMTGVEGRTYYLSVELGEETYTAQSTMPIAVTIDSVRMYNIPAFDEYYPMVYFKDPAGIANYYRFKLYVEGQYIPNISVTRDQDRDGQQMSRLLTVEEDYLEKDKIEKGDRIYVETHFLDKGAYTYFRDLGRIGMNMTNPTSNIEGGCLGYFSAYSYNRTAIIADWEE